MNTKKIISDAMYHLLKNNSFKKITIQMVLEESKVSRSTFYKYFKDKYELMNWCYQSYVDTLLLQVHAGNWKDTLCLIFRFLDDNHEYFENAAKVQGKNSFFDFLYNYSYNFYKSVYLQNTHLETLDSEARVVLEYTCMGAIFIVQNWLINGRRESISDMAEWTFKLIPEMYRKYL
jgi:probable dihydroxyacetone kinase regulator